ncbi:aminoglycoside 6-adenylyltransferase [Lapidilactobacillus mulanensis]|uniref:Aminoglycoside 6-adenylyltransferase n=1 Tax=Lapidilactobacillus mulanensis TaxID=2485999 RepID=A0ABW4DTD7_9LACO|nr:aminoglycoside 6-adenylyltransferase [Lapidilactobacillus mulanensis]
MKQDQTMLQLQRFFNQNDDLRVFGMNGSRTNAHIAEDNFKDYDVVFFTDNVAKYQKETTFLHEFGAPMLITTPGHDGLYAPEEQDVDGRYVYLVLYQSGLRIDWQFRPLKQLTGYLTEDTLTRIVSDKDGRVTEAVNPSDRKYWLRRPTPQEFQSAIKEFWWQFCNTLKATIRQETFLAQFYLNLTRTELIRLLTWHVASTHGFDRSYGKEFQQTQAYLDAKTQREIWTSFDTSSIRNIYAALKSMAQLEKKYTQLVADQQHFETKPVLGLAQVPIIYLKSKHEDELAVYFDQNKATLLDQLADELIDWAKNEPAIESLVVVGSYAHDDQRPGSDLDLVVVTSDRASLLQNTDYTQRFGKVKQVQTEYYGACISIRASYEDNSELEIGLVTPDWLNEPLDSGTRKVLQPGYLILYDQKHNFKDLSLG